MGKQTIKVASPIRIRPDKPLPTVPKMSYLTDCKPQGPSAKFKLKGTPGLINCKVLILNWDLPT